MSEEYTSRKQITFDLNQDLLSKNYPRPALSINPKYYKKAYSDISLFMAKNDFEHRQYSVYTSTNHLTTYDIVGLMERLAQSMPWLYKCVNEIDVTDIGDTQHSIKQTLEDATMSLNIAIEKEETPDPPETSEKTPGFSMNEWQSLINREKMNASKDIGGEKGREKNNGLDR